MRSGRLPSLDVLRAGAIFLVIGRHISLPEQSDMLAWVWYPLAIWYRCGWVGVDLFFVLSGFLVSGVLFQEYQRHGSLRLGWFWVRRGLKIYPNFYLFLIVTLLMTCWQGKTYPTTWVVAEVFFFQNYVGGLWNHTWSLAVEEHFYILLPVLLRVLVWVNGNGKTPFDAIPRIFIVLAIVVLLMRTWNAFTQPYAHMTHMFPTHLRIDGLFFGVLIAYGYHFYFDKYVAYCRRWMKVFWVGGSALLALAVVLPHNAVVMQSVGLTGLYIGSGLLLSAAVVWNFSGGRFWKILARIGRDSYSIYLWHMPVKVWILPLFFMSSSFLSVIVFGASSLGVGMFVAKFFEWPILKLRDRWFPSRS